MRPRAVAAGADLSRVFAAGMMAASGGMLVAMASGTAWLGVVATLGVYVCSCALGVQVFNMLYRWAEGPRAATDYALLFGAAFFASMPVRVGGAALAAATGWTAFFALAIPVYAAAFLVLRAAIERTVGGDARRRPCSATSRNTPPDGDAVGACCSSSDKVIGQPNR